MIVVQVGLFIMPNSIKKTRAHVLLNYSIWGPSSNGQRLNQLQRAGSLFQDMSEEASGFECQTGNENRFKLIDALQHRKDGDLGCASQLLLSITEMPFCTETSRAILNYETLPSEENRIFLRWDQPEWRLIQKTPPDVLVKTDARGEFLELGFENQQSERDLFSYGWVGPISAANLKMIRISVELSMGTFLTVDIVKDSQLERVLSYASGENQLEVFEFPVESETIDQIFISLSEPDENQISQDGYYAKLFAPELVFDTQSKSCAP